VGRGLFDKGGNMKKYHVQIVVEQDEDGIYVASCPALEGCYSEGGTFEEAIENVKDVIGMCLEEMQEEHRKIDLKYPEIVGIKHLEVHV
jgi:predicted RNase H-like HicB family nuclease